MFLVFKLKVNLLYGGLDESEVTRLEAALDGLGAQTGSVARQLRSDIRTVLRNARVDREVPAGSNSTTVEMAEQVFANLDAHGDGKLQLSGGDEGHLVIIGTEGTVGSTDNVVTTASGQSYGRSGPDGPAATGGQMDGSGGRVISTTDVLESKSYLTPEARRERVAEAMAATAALSPYQEDAKRRIAGLFFDIEEEYGALFHRQDKLIAKVNELIEKHVERDGKVRDEEKMRKDAEGVVAESDAVLTEDELAEIGDKFKDNVDFTMAGPDAGDLSGGVVEGEARERRPDGTFAPTSPAEELEESEEFGGYLDEDEDEDDGSDREGEGEASEPEPDPGPDSDPDEGPGGGYAGPDFSDVPDAEDSRMDNLRSAVNDYKEQASAERDAERKALNADKSSARKALPEPPGYKQRNGRGGHEFGRR